MDNPDVVIIGGGAAGLLCAIEAGRRGRQVLVLEHSNKVGKKILMSGGGRCNFTNLHTTPDNYLSGNPHFCRSALARYTQWNFIAMVERHRIAYHEKELGQLFCDESSKQILRMLLAECADAGVTIRTEVEVTSIQPATEGFRLQMATGEVRCQALVIASGGLSIPKMGATGFGYAVARQFGHGIRPTRAGLVPLTLSGKPLDDVVELAGVSTPAVTRCGNQEFPGAVLFTHRGLSGPAILQISSYWNPGDALTLDLLPGRDAADELLARKRERASGLLVASLAEVLPRRLAQRLCELDAMPEVLQHSSDAELREFGERLNGWAVKASGTEGYRTAEVTLGGVDTNELSSQTMESRLQPGLYFIGEVVDVNGHLGGFNFQWAWSSGYAAGQVC